MSPTMAELLNALPIDSDEAPSSRDELRSLADELSRREIPTGRFRRMWILGTLHGKLAAAYLAWWLRSFVTDADENERRLNETHLRAAIRTLGSMSYLRGAVMKVGQLLANYPDVVPDQFAEALGYLHFEAPPMHFSLLREFVERELGAPPEAIFDDFETKAFAAASLGQVHRARLKGTSTRVAIKIQYPGIARTIRDDFRNMKAVISPMRLGGDWDSLKRMFEDVRGMLELETDYEREAANLRTARSAFREDEGIVVPRVHEQWSTRRVLTMDYLDGVHLEPLLDSNPSRELRDAYGRLIVLANFRLSYHTHLLYADPHPGNYLFLRDGRLGLIDFGCCHHYSPHDIDYLNQAEQAIHLDRDAQRRVIAYAADMTPRQEGDEARMKLLEAYCDWLWEPLVHEGPFDFSDGAYFQRGIDLYGEMMKRRYVRSLPINIWLTRMFFGVRALLTRLGSRVDVHSLVAQESTVPSVA